MPFGHKLAHRLALLKGRFYRGALLALGLSFVASCEKPIPLGPNNSVTQFVVSPSTATVPPNQNADFMAVGFTAAGDTAQIAVTWSAPGGIVDTNSTGGRHYGHFRSATCGQYNLTAKSNPGNLSASASVSVTCSVATVTISPSSVNLQSGQTSQLTAVLKDANGNVLTGRTVTWSSDNGGVATVSGTGLVTASGAGTATITAMSEGKSGTASVTVSSIPVASVTVSPTTASLFVGQTVQLTATPRDASGNPLLGRPVAWTTSDGTIASVSSTGLVTGVAAGGPVTITATSEGKSGSATVTVAAPPPPSSCKTSSLTWQSTPFATQNGSFTAEFDATPNGARIDGVTGLSQGTAGAYTDLAAIVQFDVTGNIDARNGGAYAAASVIPYTAGTTYHFRLVVDVPSHTYSAYVRPAGGSEVTVGAGFAFRTEQSAATALANWVVYSDSATHTVCNFAITSSTPPAPVASVTVTPASATVAAGGTMQLTATPKDANGNPLTGRAVTWSSNNTAVATVNSGGLVTGVAAGSATITATSEGQSGSAAITVIIVPVASVTVTPATASVPAGGTVQLTATPRDANGNPLSGRVITWQSSDNTTASVNTSGLVTGIKAGGPVTITATSEGQSGTAAVTVTAASAAQFDHVFIVMEENNDYASVTSSSMPYLTGLAAQYGLATQYYANTHPSIGNYLEITGGQIITNNDSYNQTVSSDNVVRHLVAAGKTWKAYAEGLPSVGFVTLDYDNGTYASRHVGLQYYTDVHDNPAQAQNMVPFTQFATDLANGTLPNYSFITPDLCNDAHDCSLNTADSWLQANIDPLVKSTFFQQNNCLLIITFDESGGDNTNGGGRVYWVAVSPTKSKRGYQSTTLYQHQSTLRLMMKGLGLTSFPGDAATAPDMSEFFNP